MVPDPALALEIQSYLSIGPALRDLPALQSWVETQKKNYKRTQAGRGHEPRATDDRKGNDCFCPGEVKRKSLSCVRLFVTPWTIQSMEFSRQEHWSGLPFPFPEDLPNPMIEHVSPTTPALQANSLLEPLER